MEKLKELFKAARVEEFALAFKRAHKTFPEKEFLRLVLPELKKHELKGRVRLLADSLAVVLPKDPAVSFPLLLQAVRTDGNPKGLEGFLAWPLTQFVENQGRQHPELSLTTLKELTKVMSAEFAIRPFLLEHTELCLQKLEAWAKDPNVHVRRLVSEGTRPRLPWGQRLPHFQRDPEACIGLLRALRHDAELYVRKSVANHLNDFSKDHPDWLVKELREWQKDFPESAAIRWIVRHSVRTLVKAGHPGALELLGYKPARVKDADLRLSPGKIKMGGKLEISFSATGVRSEDWLIDYCVYHRKSNGKLAPKVFKWTKKSPRAGEKVTMQKSHAFRKITTRKYYGGSHEIEILVNGRPVVKKGFQLSLS